MIQRIQTVWLFLAVIFAALTYKFPFYTGNIIGKDNVQRFLSLNATSNFILLILTAGFIAGTTAIIFMYKNRKQQLWLTVVAACLSIINLVIYFYEIKKIHQWEYVVNCYSCICPACPSYFCGKWHPER